MPYVSPEEHNKNEKHCKTKSCFEKFDTIARQHVLERDRERG